jgi:NADH:ubiquinone oxidoreductase subunit 5 (subunit L)/multisubunit Na+/H+ antiporter MnhA subunit
MGTSDQPTILVTGIITMLVGVGFAVVKSDRRPRLAALACAIYGLYLTLLGSGVVS